MSDHHNPETEELSDLFIADLLDAVSQPHVERGVSRDDIYMFRRKLYAVIREVTQETWTEAHTLILHDPYRNLDLTLWRALDENTSFNVPVYDYRKPWPQLPTTGQVLVTLAQLSPVQTVSQHPDGYRDLEF